MHRPTDRRLRAPGFTLVETLVALAIVAISVVMLAALVGNEPRALRRLEAHREAWQVMGEALETLRAAPSAPSSGGIDPSTFLAGAPAAETLALDLLASEVSGGRGLYTLQLTATYRVTGRAYTRTVDTVLWRPVP